MLQLDADTIAEDAKWRVLFLDGDADLLDGRTFGEDRGSNSGGNVFQEVRGHGHLLADNADEARVVGCAVKLVIAPCRSIHIDKGRDCHKEVRPDGTLLRRYTMTGIDLDAVDRYLTFTIYHLAIFLWLVVRG